MDGAALHTNEWLLDVDETGRPVAKQVGWVLHTLMHVMLLWWMRDAESVDSLAARGWLLDVDVNEMGQT